MRFLVLAFLLASCAAVPSSEVPEGGMASMKPQKICEGKVALSSLNDTECGGRAFWAPYTFFGDSFEFADSAFKDAHDQTIILPEIEPFFIRQTAANGGWAAALQTARAYLRLPRFAQRDMFWATASQCPRLSKQPEPQNADTYKTLFNAAVFASQSDDGRSQPKLCRDSDDVVTALQHGRPVIMFNNDHAFVVAGARYKYPVTDGGHVFHKVESLYVLDPAGEGEIEEISRYSACAAEAFITF